jgi:N-acetylglucosamine malate deacetylase 2
MPPDRSQDSRENLLNTEKFGRVLALVAHPDDETIACSGLLQRAATSLVVYAVDGAPPHYGYEKQFGSLRRYSDIRFGEASRALNHVPDCAMRRLTRQGGEFFPDQHLFLELPEAFASLMRLTSEFSPDLVVFHAFEGGHIDHDACHILARRAASALNVPALEFPLYWQSKDGKDVFHRFREQSEDEFVLQLSCEESAVKRKMFCEYGTQQNLLSVFQADVERFRPISRAHNIRPVWQNYPFENRWRPLKVESFLQKVAEFQ